MKMKEMTLIDSSSNKIKEIQLKLFGLNSEIDAQKIESALLKIDGVHKISLNQINNKIIIEFDPAKLVIETLVETIEEIDYGAIVTSEFQDLEQKCIFRYIGDSMIYLRGFLNALQKKDGISDVKVNVGMKSVQIRFNPNKIKITEIKNLYFDLSFIQSI